MDFWIEMLYLDERRVSWLVRIKDRWTKGGDGAMVDDEAQRIAAPPPLGVNGILLL